MHLDVLATCVHMYVPGLVSADVVDWPPPVIISTNVRPFPALAQSCPIGSTRIDDYSHTIGPVHGCQDAQDRHHG